MVTMVTRAARAVNPPIFSNFVQGGQSKHPISRYMERKIRDQNNKELWRNTLTTLDTSSREEVPAYLPLAAINLPEVVKASERAKKQILKVVTAI